MWLAERGTPLVLGMIDIDHFKRVNDGYGHAAGDRVLAEVAARIRGAVRDFDIVGRLGGEDFLVIFANCDVAAARNASERIRERVAAKPIDVPGAVVNVTVSIGLAAYGCAPQSGTELLAVADGPMYRAKASGQNAVVAQEDMDAAAPAAP